jgi:hypothetical protein
MWIKGYELNTSEIARVIRINKLYNIAISVYFIISSLFYTNYIK